jgi:hypothetical protein
MALIYSILAFVREDRWGKISFSLLNLVATLAVLGLKDLTHWAKPKNIKLTKYPIIKMFRL